MTQNELCTQCAAEAYHSRMNLDEMGCDNGQGTCGSVYRKIEAVEGNREQHQGMAGTGPETEKRVQELAADTEGNNV